MYGEWLSSNNNVIVLHLFKEIKKEALTIETGYKFIKLMQKYNRISKVSIHRQSNFTQHKLSEIIISCFQIHMYFVNSEHIWNKKKKKKLIKISYTVQIRIFIIFDDFRIWKRMGYKTENGIAISLSFFFYMFYMRRK